MLSEIYPLENKFSLQQSTLLHISNQLIFSNQPNFHFFIFIITNSNKRIRNFDYNCSKRFINNILLTATYLVHTHSTVFNSQLDTACNKDAEYFRKIRFITDLFRSSSTTLFSGVRKATPSTSLTPVICVSNLVEPAVRYLLQNATTGIKILQLVVVPRAELYMIIYTGVQ